MDFQGEAGRLAVEQTSVVEAGFEIRVEVGGGSAQSSHDFRLAGNARIEELSLRHVDSGADIDLVARVISVEQSRSVRARRLQIGEAEAAVRQRLCGAGQRELPAG